jgi:hypothetical protein
MTKVATVIKAGDTVIWNIGNGGYFDGNALPSWTGINGTSTAPITIHGEAYPSTPTYTTAVIFSSHTQMDFTNCTWIHVYGFFAQNNLNTDHTIQLVDSSSNTFERFQIKNGSVYLDDFANIIDVGGTTGKGSTYNLFQDFGIFGLVRYGIMIGGSAGFSENNIVNRGVCRADFNNSSNPSACFSDYGATSGIDGARKNWILNCIALDENPDSFFIGAEAYYGGFYNPHAATDINVIGSISMNHAQRGFLLQEDAGSARNNVKQSVAWRVGSQTNDDAIYLGSGGNGASVIDHVTIATVTGTGSNGIGDYGSETLTVSNNLFMNLANGLGVTAGANNHFNGVAASGTNQSSGTIAGYGCMVSIPAGTQATGTGSDGLDRGATILKQYGNGQIFGVAGSTTITTTSLWPWPYETQAHNWASRADESQWSGKGSNPSRGFAASTWTLTQYINDAVSRNGCGFDSLYAVDASSPGAPTNLSTTAVTSSSFNYSVTASTDADGAGDINAYYIDVSTDNFSTFSAGYHDFNLGNNITGSITGLTASTTYSWRMYAKDGTGNQGPYSTTQTAVTSAAAGGGTNYGMFFKGSMTVGGGVRIVSQ